MFSSVLNHSLTCIVIIGAITLLIVSFALQTAAESTAEQPVIQSESDRPIHRQYGDWTSSRIGGGGYILGVRYTADPQVLYAWTDVGGAYRSDDGGATWTHITYTMPYGGTSESRGMMYVRDMLTDPADPDRVTLAIGYHWSPRYGIYITDDGGQNWRQTLEAWYAGDDNSRMDGAVLVRDPSLPDRLWTLALKDGLFRSDDNGESWAALGGPELQPADLLIDRQNNGRLWAAGTSIDIPMDAARANREGTSLVLGPGLWRSDDGGVSWQQLIESREVRRLVQDPGNPGRLYGIFDDHTSVEISDDAGETWRPYGEGLAIGNASPWGPHSHRYQDLGIDRGQVYATSSKGDVYLLDLEQDRWQRLGPDTIIDPEGWWGATPDDPTVGTTDWVTTMSSVARLTFSPHAPDVMWMTDWFSAYQTTDGGRTWTNRTEGIEVTYIDALEQDPSSPGIVHLGMADNGYFRSTDGGIRFQGISHDTLITNNIKSISVPAGNPNRVYAIGPNPPGGGWYAGQVYISDDKGLSWRVSPMTGLPAIEENGYRAFTIQAIDSQPDTVFLTVTLAIGEGAGGLYRSTDGGETWQPFSEGLPQRVAFYRNEAWRGGKELAIAPDHVMLTQSIAHDLIYRRGPGDDAWSLLDVSFDGEVNDLRADPFHAGRFYAAVMDDGVYRSDDHGGSWQKLDTPATAPGASQLIIDRVVPGRIAAGTSHGVVLSLDGGENWTHLDTSLPGRVDWNKGAFAGDRLVVGTGGVGVYWIDLDSIKIANHAEHLSAQPNRYFPQSRPFGELNSNRHPTIKTRQIQR